MNYNNLKISIKQAEEILLNLYDIKGKVLELPGEVDFNFRIKIENEEGFILKISRPNEDLKYLDFYQKLLQYVEKNDSNLIAPQVINDIKGNSISNITDVHGSIRKVRLLTWIPGRIWNDVNPQLDGLRLSLGEQCGLLTKALLGFEHPAATREFVWEINQSLWTKEYIHLFNEQEKEIITYFQNLFEANFNDFQKLRKSVVHNDANENNIIVTKNLKNPKVTAIIDYGDAVYTQIINDLAVTCAYAVMNHCNPLDAALPIIKGYHSKFPLTEKELIHLYVAIAMRLVISVTKSALNKIEEPDNTYLVASEKQAWEVLKKWFLISPDFAHYCFRNACNFSAHPNEVNFKKWASQNSFQLNDLFPTIKKNEIQPLDLSVSSTWIGHQEEFNDLDLFEYKINKLQKEENDKIIAGGYLEPRPIYTSSAFDSIGNNGRESRTVHLGVDFWLPNTTPIHALFNSEVVTAVIDAGYKLYGGLLILKHQVEGLTFFTLYGHLSVDSISTKKIGDTIKKGDVIGFLGNKLENGNWVPHLHFQIMLSMLNYNIDFPGVAFHKQIDVWKSICPNPNFLFNTKGLQQPKTNSNEALLLYRKQHLGKSLSLQYHVPIKMVRGLGSYLMDQFGKKYLDTVNNVAHVGHENYHVVKAGQEQMALVNTNSRYLHENINLLTKELLETLPPELNVIHFVNSGSEANELAIRMVKAVTGERDIIASEVGYHGNSNMCIAISSYKFDGKGGKGAPKYTHIFPLPDTFRGKYRGNTVGDSYAEEVKKRIKKIQNKGRNVAGFIIEPIISCGGQIELPTGFLSKAYQYIREAGGICISDEVQTGCGRMGKTFWGFQLHNVLPDIVTIGKPIGNGHPLAAVVCTQEVAEKFANGMEYFNTFGGNPVSCAIGTEVLCFVKREKLQENALIIGEYLKSELKKLAIEFPIIGDVRGQGLFLGVELVDEKRNPLKAQTNYLANRMKDYGILMSTDGPDHNVLKIKPPIVFNKENAKELIFYLKKIFAEDFMKSY
ncbi:aminotransferase class III-fold pyridoxal phosphate-dependent enzyme [Lutibacter maritimus]|uniref:Hydroxylysine kinase /5-phosphonooxy-L-lysine phospho-lyase apoenzyme n=1 Tax=Lutibacter maritimus TaxID=593133 RepID=A0A1I6Q9F3_9FLAO|nr:aminotransferase class III-fold pyridoxal phosphate-dependent enzyme [Lutibacter maritimus]SFS49077.1 hydroxylysine kinase /5-phosphonooxy-L-lysine phospho-lyase apoenzyme [Lutibacter maritimus]